MVQHESGEDRYAAVQAAHQITLIERGPFLAPRCVCGWQGAARRSRPLARDEAATHVLEATQ